MTTSQAGVRNFIDIDNNNVIDNRASSAGDGKKNENPSKVKNIKKLAKLKNSDFIKSLNIFTGTNLSYPQSINYQIFSTFEIAQKYSIAFFFSKDILRVTWYMTFDGKVLIFIEIFKT